MELYLVLLLVAMVSQRGRSDPIWEPCSKGFIAWEGQCYQLLTTKLCDQGYWLVLTDLDDPDTAQCKLRPCPEDRMFYRGDCFVPEDSAACKGFQRLYETPTGEALCRDHIPASRSICWPAHGCNPSGRSVCWPEEGCF